MVGVFVGASTSILADALEEMMTEFS